MRATANRIAKSTAWIAYSNILQNVISLISTVILARLLTPEDFGIVALAAVSLAVVETMLDIPVGKALIGLGTLNNNHFNTSFAISTIRGVLIFIAMALGSLVIEAVYSEPRVVPIMLVIGLTSIITSMGNPKFILFEKNLDYSWEVKINVFSRIIATIACVISAFVFKTYWALIIASVIYGPLRTALGYYAKPYLPKFSLKEWRVIFTFTGWATLAGIVNSLSVRVDTYLVGYFTSNSFLGAYQIGNELSTKITYGILGPLSRPLLPAFSSFTDDLSKLKQVYLKSLQTIMLVSIPIGVGTAYVAPIFVPIALGDGWSNAILPMQLLALSFTILAIGRPATSLAEATHNTKLIFFRQLIFSVTRIPILILATIFFGIEGLLLAILAMSFVYVAVSFSLAHNILNVSVLAQLYCAYRSYFSAAAMAGTLWISTTVMANAHPILILSAQVIVGSSIYVLSHIAIWYLTGKPSGAESAVLKITNQIKNQLTEKIKSRQA